jgi:hypothetical protein
LQEHSIHDYAVEVRFKLVVSQANARTYFSLLFLASTLFWLLENQKSAYKFNLTQLVKIYTLQHYVIIKLHSQVVNLT